MVETLLIVIGVGVLALLALAGIALARVTMLVRTRDANASAGADLQGRLASLGTRLSDHERDVRTDLAIARNEAAGAATSLRQELGDLVARQQESMGRELGTMSALSRDQLRAFGERISQLTQSTEARLEALRRAVEQRLDVLREENARKLDEMRATVDDKLQATLEQRLGASFKLVSDRLEQVHRGLGEMQTLAAGVGDLKRVLQNVKTRGGWGEVQLATLLAEMLTPQQYEANVMTRPGSNRRVEFAIRLPGRGDDGMPCWLPIDAKFPLDHWQRLQEALERADLPAADESRKALDAFLRSEAKVIRESYVAPPHTTDFAILFLPTEGLYAEMMSRPGFADTLQRESRVLITGPMNLAALLNSLQMGFRSLAIEQRSSEVWRVLAAVKTEFTKFGEVLATTKKRLDSVSSSIGDAEVRTRQIARRLKDVETLPEPEAMRLLDEGLTLDMPETAPDEK
ncbi:MAG TPA: DNA recombination protein RmuC [Casimicrobiaceae bacterium]|nr:DNA recombination protein RmuC [Casimicrobiaceae bacterium]